MRAAAAWRRLAATLRRSMTVRIALSITVTSLLLVAGYATILDRLVAKELRDQNELKLLTSLITLKEDLAQLGDGLTTLGPLLRRESRYNGVQIQLSDAHGQILARSWDIALPAAMATEFRAADLPGPGDLPALRRVRAAARPASAQWQAPDGHPYQLLFGRLTLGGAGEGAPREVHVALAIGSGKTLEVRRGERWRLVGALLATALVASALGLLIARSVLIDTRRFGTAAARISAQALHERLRPDEVPRELEDSARAFNRMLDRLQSGFERLSRFSAEVAHDLRTPIGNLLGEAQVALSRARTSEEYRAVLESAVEEYERMSRMIGNMLFLARADNEQTLPACELLPVGQLIQRVVSYFEQLAEERHISLRAAALDAAGMLFGDDSLVTRALGNLVSNALRYAPPGSEVAVTARTAADGACDISVSNRGPRIPAEHLERIFERFYRIDPARDASSGSGLGLAIVRSIAVLHGGRVTVSSDDAATTFTLHFPPRR